MQLMGEGPGRSGFGVAGTSHHARGLQEEAGGGIGHLCSTNCMQGRAFPGSQPSEAPVVCWAQGLTPGRRALSPFADAEIEAVAQDHTGWWAGTCTEHWLL